MNFDNHLRKKFKEQRKVIGTWNTLSSVVATEVMSSSGLDFQIIDFEHGPFSLDNVHLHVNACKLNKCSPIVRLPKLEDWMVLQALDQGADGVLVPHINSKKDAMDLVKFSKYFPQGNRGFTPFAKAGNFSDINLKNHLKRSSETILGIIIESEEGLENLDEILTVKEIDFIYFGAYDISQALGYPGDVRHATVLKKITHAISKVNKSNKVAGGFIARNESDLNWLVNIGINLVTFELDSLALFERFNHISNYFDQFR